MSKKQIIEITNEAGETVRTEQLTFEIALKKVRFAVETMTRVEELKGDEKVAFMNSIHPELADETEYIYKVITNLDMFKSSLKSETDTEPFDFRASFEGYVVFENVVAEGEKLCGKDFVVSEDELNSLIYSDTTVSQAILKEQMSIINKCKDDLIAVSYTHLTLPTILRV